MRKLPPAVLLAIGTLLFASLFALVVAVFDADARTLAGVLNSFVGGAVVGWLCLSPIALAEIYRSGLLRILEPRWFHVQFYISTFMALALGYLLACARHRLFDGFAAVAFAVVFVSALLKTMMAVLARPDPCEA